MCKLLDAALLLLLLLLLPGHSCTRLLCLSLLIRLLRACPCICLTRNCPCHRRRCCTVCDDMRQLHLHCCQSVALCCSCCCCCGCLQLLKQQLFQELCRDRALMGQVTSKE
jgi:hypothetical protein